MGTNHVEEDLGRGRALESIYRLFFCLELRYRRVVWRFFFFHTIAVPYGKPAIIHVAELINTLMSPPEMGKNLFHSRDK